MRGRTIQKLSGTLSYLDAGGEQTIAEITGGTAKWLRAIWVDAENWTNNPNVKVYYKVDGTNYRQLPTVIIVLGTNKTYPIFYGVLTYGDIKITISESGDEGSAISTPWEVLLEYP